MEKSEAYKEGYQAYLDQLSENDCPYVEGTQEQSDWDDGYEQASYDEEAEKDNDE